MPSQIWRITVAYPSEVALPRNPHRHCGLLRACLDWPRKCATHQGQELAPFHFDHLIGAGKQGWRVLRGQVPWRLDVARQLYFVGACAAPEHSLHSSQSFHETAIAEPDSTDARVVQVDRHPQSNRKSRPVNRVEQRKPATRTTIAEAQ